MSARETDIAGEPLHPAMRGRANRARFQAVFTRIVEHFYEAGYVTDDDLSDAERLYEKVFSFKSAGIEFKSVVDHREVLIDAADRYTREGRAEMAMMFYALFFEHTINQIILHGCREAGQKQKTADAVLRTVNFDGKVSWVLDILDLPPLNEAHRRTMARVAQERNAFVHYKWKEMSSGDGSKRETDELLRAAKKAVAYVKRYESRLILRGNKALIARLTRLDIPQVPPLRTEGVS